MLKRIALSFLVLCALLVGTAGAATVDGIPIHSSSSGTGDRTVILVHGWTCDSTSWDAQVPALSKDYRVITVDLPGHGRSGSPKNGQFSMNLFARAIEAVRAEARADRVVLVGHSMGTPVILAYTQLFPQHVAALVAVDGLVAGPQAGAAPAGGAAVQPPDVTGPDGRKAREAMIRGMFVATTPKAVQDKVMKMMLAAPEATAAGAMQAMFAWMATADATVRSFPVLGLYAEKSRAAAPDAAKKIFPAFEYTELPGTGHFLMMEKPQEFNARLTTFLTKVKY
jgi:pimeloyl-ACP methyl ester carboxylesterase